MRALLVPFTIVVIGGVVVWLVWEYTRKATPEAVRGATLASLARQAAAAHAAGNHGEGERLDHAYNELLRAMTEGKARRWDGSPQDDWTGYVVKGGLSADAPPPRATGAVPGPPLRRRRPTDEALADWQAAMEELRQAVLDYEAEVDLPPVKPRIKPEGDGSNIPEHLRQRAADARKRARPKRDV